MQTQRNAQLIQSIAQQHLNAVSDIVFKNMMVGTRADAIVEQIEDYGVTRARAKLIARDQTSKVQCSINAVRQQSAGFKYFRWSTSNDERVRESHRHVANAVTEYGKGVYAWDDLPEVDGEKAYPGSGIQCRCVAIPVLQSEVEAFKARKS